MPAALHLVSTSRCQEEHSSPLPPDLDLHPRWNKWGGYQIKGEDTDQFTSSVTHTAASNWTSSTPVNTHWTWQAGRGSTCYSHCLLQSCVLPSLGTFEPFSCHIIQTAIAMHCKSQTQNGSTIINHQLWMRSDDYQFWKKGGFEGNTTGN